MQAFSGQVDFEVTWKPFFLNRDTPEAGVPLLVYLEKKFGPQAKKAALEGRSPLTQSGRAVVSGFFLSESGASIDINLVGALSIPQKDMEKKELT